MNIFPVLNLIGGLAMFLYGMDIMGKSLERQAGNRLQSILEKLTTNKYKGFLLGMLITCIIQSSSTTTVMVVGFVNSGIMKLSQACGVIMGANVGTTITAWILSLTGISGDSIFMQLLKPDAWTPVLGLVGIILYMFTKHSEQKNIGNILLGFVILMFGMETMSGAFKPLTKEAWFTDMFTMFSSPFLGFLVGLVLTSIVQSSSATVGILQALALTGVITFEAAIPMLLGINIGTCVTAMIASLGSNANARRASMIHLLFNVIGAVVCMTIYIIMRYALALPFLPTVTNAVGIAVCHTVIKGINTALLLPVSSQLEKLAVAMIKDTAKEDDIERIDPLLLNTPAIAAEQCRVITGHMAETARVALSKSLRMIGSYTVKDGEEIVQLEDRLDRYEDMLGSYLVKLSAKNLNGPESRDVSEMLHMIGDFERIGDHSLNLKEVAQELYEKKLMFSEEAQKEINVLTECIEKVLSLAMEAFENNDLSLARRVEPLEQVVDDLTKDLRARHINRLKEGRCTIELGFILSDLTTNCERVADHCSNIAAALIETSMRSFDLHNYTDHISSSDLFQMYYKEYREKYALPV